jgi:hypothetical protein
VGLKRPRARFETWVRGEFIPLLRSAKTQKAVIARIPARVTDVMSALVIFLQPPPQLLSTHNACAKYTRDSEHDRALKTVTMGIKHLFQLIQEHAPAAVKTGEIKNQFGRKVAIVRMLYRPRTIGY